MEYRIQDLTTVDYGIIAHGVNCQGVMGSGVAKAIRDKWPEVYEAYMRVSPSNDSLGATTLVCVGPGLYVANCFTQIFYGRGGRFANPNAIEQSLRRVYEWASVYELPVYMPKIGAGLGGLDWELEVEPIILKLDHDHYDVDTFVCVVDESELPQG